MGGGSRNSIYLVIDPHTMENGTIYGTQAASPNFTFEGEVSPETQGGSSPFASGLKSNRPKAITIETVAESGDYPGAAFTYFSNLPALG